MAFRSHTPFFRRFVKICTHSTPWRQTLTLGFGYPWLAMCAVTKLHSVWDCCLTNGALINRYYTQVHCLAGEEGTL